MRILLKKRKGLTLIEMMGAAVIIGMLAAGAAMVYTKVHTNALHKVADQRFAIVAQALQMHRVDHGSYPNQLSDLLTTHGNITDGIKNNSGAYRYRFYLQEMPLDPFLQNSPGAESAKYFSWNKTKNHLVSVGPDRQAGTSDDICYSVENFRREGC